MHILHPLRFGPVGIGLPEIQVFRYLVEDAHNYDLSVTTVKQ